MSNTTNPHTYRPDTLRFSQYCEALTYELSGRCFQLKLESGARFAIQFLDGQMVCWGEQHQPMRWDTYQCLKLDDDTYLVHINLQDSMLGRYATLILDNSSRHVLVAVVPNLKQAQALLYTGEICVPGYPEINTPLLTSTDFDNHSILWRFGSNCAALQAFTCDAGVNISYTDPWDPITDGADSVHCAANVYRIREDVYAVSIHGLAAGEPMGEQFMVMNTNAIRCVGCCISPGAANSQLFSGAGAFIPPEAAKTNTNGEGSL